LDRSPSFVIMHNTDCALIVQDLVALATGTLGSSRVFFNQIHCFVVSTSAIYLASDVEVATDFCFLERPTDCQIGEL
jgi:hypothetical protein